MDKRSLFYLTIVMSTFLLLNTFVFDNSKAQLKEANATENIEVDHLPIADLKNTIGDTVCKAVTLGDTFITLSSDRLPSTLLHGSTTVHLMKQSEGNVFLYSDKISPMLNASPPLKAKDDFLVLTDFSENSPKLAAATVENGVINFLFDSPEADGLVVKNSKDGLAFVGIWSDSKKTFTSAYDMENFKDMVAAKNFSGSKTPEKFYCLENDSIQVVFSNKGGAVSEFNMKLRTKSDLRSPVLPVGVDRKISDESPQNNLYPLHPTSIAHTDSSNSLMKNVVGGYTPLLRRDIVDSNREVVFKVPPKHYALALTSENNDYIPTYKVTKFTKDFIQFKGEINGKEVTRSYSLIKDTAFSLNMKTSMNGNISSLQISSGIPEVEIDSGSAAPSLLYYNYNGKKMKLEAFKMPKDSLTKDGIEPSWTANSNGFFATILHPKGDGPKGVTVEKIEGKNCPSRVTLVGINKALNPKEKFPGYVIQTPYKPSLTPASYYFYGGPLDKPVLTKIDQALTDKTTGFNPEFVKVITVRGWLTFVSDPFAKFMNIILNFFHQITHSWGVSVILLTVALKLLLYPFTAKAFKSMLKMKQIAPKQKEIEAKYKNDPQRLRVELSMLFRNEGVNPLASILPMILQIPFFIGMFDLIKTKFALRGAMFIPGWIENLSAPDALFSWGVNIPFLGNEFHLLPILGALSMYLSQKFTTSQQPVKKNPTDMEKQMQMMGPIMTLVFLVVFYNLASGLNIYLIISSLLGVAQQWYINHKFGEKNPNVTVMKS